MTEAAAVSPGCVLDTRYRLLQKLGAGGQGEVWRAHDGKRGHEVALKILNPPLARDARAWASLEHEHAIASRLDHPSILKVFAPEHVGELAVLPMELAPGGDLRGLRCTGYLEIVPVLIEVAQALEHAHERGVIHRDLKPSNVLFDVRHRVKLADFGIAGMRAKAASVHAGKGSPFSASPGQLRGEPPQPADDIYGLGSLAYELLSGYPPHYPHFDAQRIIAEPAPELVPARPAPALLTTLVMRMLAKDASRRPRSMRAVIDELDTAMHDSAGFDFEALGEADRGRPAAVGLPADHKTEELLPMEIGELEDEDAPQETAPSGRRKPADRDEVPHRPAGQVRSARAAAAPTEVIPARSALTPARVPAPWRDLGLTSVPGPANLPTMSAIRGSLITAGLVVGAVLLGVLFMVRHSFSSGSGSPAAVAQDGTAPLAAQEQRFQGLREHFAAQLGSLEARGAGIWGGAAFATAKTLAAESTGAHDAGNVQMAAERLERASQLLEQVLAGAPIALEAQLAAGERSLAAGQQELALQAFDLAHRIDPNDRRGVQGERRARGLNGLLPLLAAARNAENAHSYSRALQDYGRALRLDPSSAPAQQGLARANAALEEEHFAKAIGTGFTALAAGRLREARAAFERARALRPQAPEPAEGLKRVAAMGAARNLTLMREHAAGLEAREQWDEAARAYDGALQQDPSLVFAVEGKERVAMRAVLARSLQALIDHPEQLASAAGREEAARLLQSASAESDPGPGLRSQLAQLKALRPELDKPVHLSLVSDSETQVTIPSIGSFGSFARREVELRPGRYTVIGTREGYRDVKRDITVAPGQESVTISIACSEADLRADAKP
jgi:tetratricopeptide (TPR) repeat protein